MNRPWAGGAGFGACPRVFPTREPSLGIVPRRRSETAPGPPAIGRLHGRLLLRLAGGDPVRTRLHERGHDLRPVEYRSRLTDVLVIGPRGDARRHTMGASLDTEGRTGRI